MPYPARFINIYVYIDLCTKIQLFSLFLLIKKREIYTQNNRSVHGSIKISYASIITMKNNPKYMHLHVFHYQKVSILLTLNYHYHHHGRFCIIHCIKNWSWACNMGPHTFIDFC